MSRRNYHEKKALRCMQNIISMKKKIKRLEEFRVKKIENIKNEIGAIHNSTVTLRCVGCNGEFPISFKLFEDGGYSLFCHLCKGKKETFDKYDIGPIFPKLILKRVL